MYFSSRCKNRTYLCWPANDPVSCKSVYGRELKFVEIRVSLLPWYRVCTKAMFSSKGSYRYGEYKNVFVSSVQKPQFPVVGLQTTPSHVSQCRAETEICGNPGQPFTMVPCLHQSNVYIKRKLRVWRVQKCTFFVGA